MRLDRVITVKMVQPLRRLRPVSAQVGDIGSHLPILMYHRISDDSQPTLAPYYKTNTKPRVFAEQMQWLAQAGYDVLNLQGAIDWVGHKPNGGAAPPSQTASASSRATVQHRCVALTFDDGFRNFYTEAFPVLHRHGFNATVALPTSFIRDSRSESVSEYMNWKEVCELQKAGIHFASHTVTHPQLVELPWKRIGHELRDSKNEMESRLGGTVSTFVFPSAFPQDNQPFLRRFSGLLAEIGYVGCATTAIGRVSRNSDPYRLKRLPMNSCDDSILFEAKLEGAYDWFGVPQAAFKKCKAWGRPGRKQVDLARE